MITNPSCLQAYQSSWHAHMASQLNDEFASWRQEQLAQFLIKQLPANLTTILSSSYPVSDKNPLLEKHCPPFISASESAYRLVFLNGHYQSHLSVTPIDDNIIITNLATALINYPAQLRAYLMQCKDESALINLNNAYLHEGAFVYVPAHCQLDRPVHLLFLGNQASCHSLRNIIVADDNANLVVFEEHVSLTDSPYVTQIVTQVIAQPAAKITYMKLQQQNADSIHIANLEVNQAKNSEVIGQKIDLGSHVAQETIFTRLYEKGATLKLQGIYLPLKKQQMSIAINVSHLADHTNCEINYRGAVASQSKGHFVGKIEVAKQIKKADAALQNKNLLLARDAEVSTKPELEIYADDVKCKHGATIGQIDANMLFYLRSRGISPEEAYKLLLVAFIQQHLEKLHPVISPKLIEIVTGYCEEVTA